MAQQRRSNCLHEQARAGDPDRYLAALFAPAERRDALLGLALLDHELARVPEVARQPMTGLIRYQWWRDAVEETAAGRTERRHPALAALAPALRRGWLAPAPLQALVDARERALEGGTGGRDLGALEARLRDTAGRVQELSLVALGGGADPAWRAAVADVGTALGLLGVIRAAAAPGHRGEAQRAGAPAGPGAPDFPEAALRRVLARAEALLARARATAGRPPRPLMAAFLPAVLARARARGIRAGGADPLRGAARPRPPGAPLALLLAYLRRRP